MSSGTYRIVLTTDAGSPVATLDNHLGLTASRNDYRIDWLNIRLPSTFDEALLRPDFMIQVWRAPPGGVKALWRPYFIRKWRYSMAGDHETLIVSGPGPKDLLRRRIAAHYAGSANATKTSIEADDLMKDIVADAIADGTNPAPDAGTRAWANLSVAADLTNGPQLSKGFAFDYLLKPSGGGILPAIAKAAREAGTEVFFDIVPKVVTDSSISFQFVTYTGQPGADVSDKVIFDRGDGNLADPFIEWDYADEENYIYAGGQGDKNLRNIQQVYDADRYGISQWNRCEGFADARTQAADNAVRETGRAKLEKGRPIVRMGGSPIDTAGTRFGRDWDYGSKVTAVYRGEFTAIVRAALIILDGKGNETIATNLGYEG